MPYDSTLYTQPPRNKPGNFIDPRAITFTQFLEIATQAPLPEFNRNFIAEWEKRNAKKRETEKALQPRDNAGRGE